MMLHLDAAFYGDKRRKINKNTLNLLKLKRLQKNKAKIKSKSKLELKIKSDNFVNFISFHNQLTSSNPNAKFFLNKVKKFINPGL